LTGSRSKLKLKLKANSKDSSSADVLNDRRFQNEITIAAKACILASEDITQLANVFHIPTRTRDTVTSFAHHTYGKNGHFGPNMIVSIIWGNIQ
jgi:hypothetical protein